MGLNYNPASVTQGLVYYLDLTNSRCYSGSGNTLINLANGAIGITIVSGITYDTDYRKNLNFNGSSGYMTGNDTNLNFSTSDFTIQTTLKLNGLSNGFTGGYGSMICAGTALTNNSSIFRFSGTATSHYALALWHQPTSTAIERNFNFQTNKIYNLAVTKRFNVVEFFVDGSSIGTVTTSNNFNFTANGFAIGRWFYPGSEQYLKGSIFDFRAYNRALSIDEIQQNYFSQTKRYYNEENIVTNGLVLNIDPSKSTSYVGLGNTIYDLSGFGNTGTLTNGPTFSGLNGGNLIFDGSNDFIGVPSNSSLDISTNLSAVVWMKLIATDGANHIIFSKTNSSSPFLSNYEAYLKNDVIYWWDSPTGRNTTVTLSVGSWTQVVFVRSSTSLLIYKNASLSNTITVNQVGPVVGDFFIGKDPNGQFLNFNLAQFILYNRALTQQEISQNFNATRGRYGL